MFSGCVTHFYLKNRNCFDILNCWTYWEYVSIIHSIWKHFLFCRVSVLVLEITALNKVLTLYVHINTSDEHYRLMTYVATIFFGTTLAFNLMWSTVMLVSFMCPRVTIQHSWWYLHVYMFHAANTSCMDKIASGLCLVSNNEAWVCFSFDESSTLF